MRYAKKNKGDSDNKEYFNYRGVTEKLLRAAISKHKNKPEIQNFLKSAGQVYKNSSGVLAGIIKKIDARHAGIYNKIFAINPERLICLRYVKYDAASRGKFLAKPHYDRGACALALAESSPGLRVGRNAKNLKEIVRNSNTAIFMPALTLNRDTCSNKFTPAWHDVVQKENLAYNKNVARWAIVLFADVCSDNSISYDDTHAIAKK